jgi:hypothetical protein
MEGREMRKRRESYHSSDARQGLFREKNLIEESANAFAIFRAENVSELSPATRKKSRSATSGTWTSPGFSSTRKRKASAVP